MKFFNLNHLSFIICLVIAILIMVSYDKNQPIYSKIEAKILDFTAPVMNITSSGLYFMSNITQDIGSFFTSFQEHKKLKERNDFLESYFYLYKQTEAENRQLKNELKFVNQLEHKYITAQIIARNNNAFNQQITINAGTQQGLEKWQVVLANNQLIGRIVQLSKNTAKILLITDQVSRIPATAINSRTKFIIAGASSNYLTCKYLNAQQELQEGELVVTNGDDSNIAAGIMVGSIFKEDGIFYVKPNLDFNNIEFVKILQPRQQDE